MRNSLRSKPCEIEASVNMAWPAPCSSLSTAPPTPGSWEKQGCTWGGNLGAPPPVSPPTLEGGVQIRHLRDGLELLAQKWGFWNCSLGWTLRPPFDHPPFSLLPRSHPLLGWGPSGPGSELEEGRRKLLMAQRKPLTPCFIPSKENKSLTF